VAKHLKSKHKALSSNPSTSPMQKKKKKSFKNQIKWKIKRLDEVYKNIDRNPLIKLCIILTKRYKNKITFIIVKIIPRLRAWLKW
jgi:hypothetical protein